VGLAIGPVAGETPPITVCMAGASVAMLGSTGVDRDLRAGAASYHSMK
jgi:hypothetical protein